MRPFRSITRTATLLTLGFLISVTLGASARLTAIPTIRWFLPIDDNSQTANWSAVGNRLAGSQTLRACSHWKAWGTIEVAFDGEQSPVLVMMGWPVPCLAGIIYPYNGNANIGMLSVGRHEFPTKPLIWHSLVNAVSIALFIQLLITVVRCTRTVWRIRRNQCAHCAYQLLRSQTRCPECGWNRPPNKGQRPSISSSPADASSTPSPSTTSPPVQSDTTGTDDTRD